MTPRGRGALGALPRLSQVARRALAAVGALALVGAGFLVAQAFLLASVLAAVVDGHTEGLESRLAWLVFVVLGRAVVVWATRVVSQRAAAGVKGELRGRAVEQALRLGPEWIAEQGPGELTAVTTRGLDALDAYFTQYLPALVTASVVPVAAGAAVLYADWPSAVVVALTVPLLPVFAILVGKHTEHRVRDSLDAMRRLSGQLLELVRALPVLTAFGRAAAQADSVRRVSERHRRAAVDSMKVAFSSALVLDLLATLSVALVAVVIGVRLVSGDLSLAIGLGVLLLVPECYQPIRAVGAAFHASEDGVEAVRRVTSVVQAEPAECWPAWCRECSGRLEPSLPLTRGRRPAQVVRVEGLRVARRDAGTTSFIARPGDITWLRAPSGGGKSTALAALLGFVRPTAGTITIGGKPLGELDPQQWRRTVAWVPQFPVLSEQTVRAELPGGDVDVVAVAEELGIEHLLDRDPRELSTGERQRVAVARALLRVRHEGAWLLLLDEPTAHLDEVNAARVLAAVRAAADAGAVVVLAAHTAAGSGSKELWSESFESRELCANPATPAAALPDREPLPLRELVGPRLLAGAGLGALGWTAGVALAVTSAWLIAKASQQPPILLLTVAIVGVRAFGLGRSSLRYVERLVTHDAAFRLATRLRVALWQALVRLGPARSLAAGEGRQRLVDDVDTVRDLVPRVLTPPLVVAAVAGVAVAVQALVLPAAGVVLAGALLVGGLGAVVLSRTVERRATALAAESRRTVVAKVLTLFDAAAELIAYGRAEKRRAELAESDSRLASLARRSALAAGLAEALVVLTTGGAAIACAALAARAVAAGQLDPILAPVLALAPLALAEVLGQLPEVARHSESLRRARSRLGAVLAACPECHIGDVQRPECHIGDITLDGVTVRWPDAGEAALHDVDLHIGRGSWVAVVGPSGAGKSTLLATLLGFLIPERGAARLPDAVVWAPQEPYLCSTSIAENLRLGDPHATDDALADALRAVCLDDYADRLDLVLTSAGTGLSGGQAGRLALARALLAARRHGRDALVLLDEPTAHLDAATAATVLDNLRTELAEHAVVHVTHRADEAADAERVLEVRDGRVHVLESV